ncbi:MAG TPA: transglutaminase domain-containing protein, partial [Myxococcales bacterium]|nr:transglutaminase domain-containing protein [Myxococcales bacterium]
MKRREFLGATLVAAALPFRRLRAEPGWRTFEVTTRAEISRPQGVSRAWLPVPLASDTDWQRALGNTWTGNAKHIEEVRSGRYGVTMLYAEWSAGEAAPFVELKSKVATRDWSVDVTRTGSARLSSAEIALYTAPTDLIPCDGLVRQTALMRAAKGANTDVEKARSIYNWIVQNTMRDPKTKGCGTGNIKAMLESGNLGGKCADLNGLFVGFCRSLDIPARDVFGIRVAPSALGYRSLGAPS